MTTDAQVCQDTVEIINDWDEETLTILRNTPTYDASSMRADSYAVIDTFLGDWQPANGNTAILEEGRKVRSDAFVIAPCAVDVLEDDRIRRADMSFMYVNHIKIYRGHITIFLKKTGGSS